MLHIPSNPGVAAIGAEVFRSPCSTAASLPIARAAASRAVVIVVQVPWTRYPPSVAPPCITDGAAPQREHVAGTAWPGKGGAGCSTLAWGWLAVMMTVAVCTWNRAHLLQQCLQRMTLLRPPPDIAWELLVVNNNSRDSTDEVIAAFAGRLPIVGIREERPGLSHARNAAAVRARGDYLVWTDDDVLVDEHWLCAYARAIRQWPEAAVFGGPVLPSFDGTPPAWLIEGWQDVDVAYASRDLGPLPFALGGAGAGLPFGANYVVRAREQRLFAYDPKLGRSQAPGLLLGGEETEVIKSILAAGGSGWWVPDARVAHFIPVERQTADYVRLYFHSRGRMNAGIVGRGSAKTLFGRPRWAWRQAVVGELRYQLLRRWAQPRRWVGAMVQASEAWGTLKGPLPESRER